MLKFDNPLDTDVDRGDVPIGTAVGGNLLYGGPKYGDVTQEEYDELLKSGKLGRGQQTVELYGEKLLQQASRVYTKVGEYIPDLPGPNETVKKGLNIAKDTAGFAYDWTIKSGVETGMEVLGLPVEVAHKLSKLQYEDGQVNFGGRGIGKAPLSIAETVLTAGGPAALKGGKALITKGDDIARLLSKTDDLAFATNGVLSEGVQAGLKNNNKPLVSNVFKAVSGINPESTMRGSKYVGGLKTLIKSDPPIKDVQGFVKTGAKELLETKPQKIQKYLEQGMSKYLKPKYKNTRAGYWNAKKLANDPKLLNKVIEKHDEVTKLFEKYKLSETRGSKSAMSNAQRELYDKIGESYFDDSALIYGKHSLGDKAREKLVKVTQWFSKDHWHHIFGNKEIGEFMLTEIAQDPLIGVNLFKHMKKRGLSVSGVADNILIMKEKGHKNFHEFLRNIGIEGKWGRTAPAGLEDFGQEVSKAVQGTAQAKKTYTTAAGEIIKKGTTYPADPEAVNELFTLIDVYADQNKWIRKKFKEGAITVMEPTGTKGLRKVVPNGYKAKKGETVVIYDLTANKAGKSKLPEVYGDKVGRIKKIVKNESN